MSQERKQFNFQSLILIEMTEKLEGYHPEKYGPSSAKFIWATCRFCGNPHRLRKGFFNKTGSACHRECKIEEQKINSPFKNKEVREKSKQTNLARYGVEFASQNVEVAKKISERKLTTESQNLSKQTVLERYGVENPFQSEEIKERIKQTNLSKFGSEYPLQSEEIKERYIDTCNKKWGCDNVSKNEEIKHKIANTNIDRYGYKSPTQNAEIQKRSVEKANETRKIDENGYFRLINTLRGEEFWKILGGQKASLKDACKHFDINYQSVTSRLLDKEFYQKYYSLYSFPKIQKQREIASFIRNLGLEITENDRSVISPMELDIYVPSKNIAIEFNGSYWHSEAILDSKKAYSLHSTKTKMCEAKGIKLLHIFEKTWEERKLQLCGFLKSMLGRNSNRIGARECGLSNNECKDFIDKYHIQGKTNSFIKYFNLEYAGEIVGSMTASRHHRQNIKGNPIVLSRLVFKNDCTIQGGASKLFNCMIEWAKKEGYDRIISWSDSSWTSGGIYKTLGFTLEKEYNPDYFYWDMNNNEYISKQSQRKSNVGCPEGLTEREWCSERGLWRIWDCGKRLWIFDLL